MTTIAPNFLRQRDYLAVTIIHFFVDVLNSSRNLLVALLAVSIGLTNAQVGLALLLYNVGNALSQPFFGSLADRVGPRWLVVGGLGWMILFFGMAALAGDWLALIALTVAGLGSGAFHPTGTMVASRIVGRQRNRATAVFFTFGQLGLFVGPILAGLLLESFGRPSYLALPLISLAALWAGWQWIENNRQQTGNQPVEKAERAKPVSLRRAVLLALIILTTGTTGFAATGFAPKLFAESGFSEGYIGLLAGMYMGGSALGNVVGGILGDRIKGKWVVLLGATLAIIPVYLYVPIAGNGRFLLLALAGFFVGMPHSILVLAVQSLFPNRRAMGSGIALGFMFFSGSVGSYILGVVADQVGLALVLQGTALLPLIAACAALFLPGKSQEPEKEADGSA